MSETAFREQRRVREYRVMVPLTDAERDLVHACDFQINSVLTIIVATLSLWEESEPASIAQRPPALQACVQNQQRLHAAVERLVDAVPALAASVRPEVRQFSDLMAQSLQVMQRLARITDLAVEFFHNHLTSEFDATAPELGKVKTYSDGLNEAHRELTALIPLVDAHPIYQSYRAVTPEDQRHHRSQET